MHVWTSVHAIYHDPPEEGALSSEDEDDLLDSKEYLELCKKLLCASAICVTVYLLIFQQGKVQRNNGI